MTTTTPSGTSRARLARQRLAKPGALLISEHKPDLLDLTQLVALSGGRSVDTYPESRPSASAATPLVGPAVGEQGDDHVW